MSEAVVLYQLSILSSVVATCLIIGPRAMGLIALSWAIWTVVQVFTGWLFILQFGTIAAAVLASATLHDSPHFQAIQTRIRRVLLWGAILGGIGIAVALYFENKNQEARRLLTENPRVDPTPSDSRQGSGSPLVDTDLADAEKRIGLKYPRLDRNNFEFSYTLFNQVMARQQDHMQRGLSRAAAFETAADEVMRAVSQTPKTIFYCNATKGGKGHFSAQDYPCDEPWRR